MTSPEPKTLSGQAIALTLMMELCSPSNIDLIYHTSKESMIEVDGKRVLDRKKLWSLANSDVTAKAITLIGTACMISALVELGVINGEALLSDFAGILKNVQQDTIRSIQATSGFPEEVKQRAIELSESRYAGTYNLARELFTLHGNGTNGPDILQGFLPWKAPLDALKVCHPEAIETIAEVEKLLKGEK